MEGLSKEDLNRHFTCRNKVRHLTKEDARSVMQHLLKHAKGGRKVHKLNVYECMYCGYWHIGHKKGKTPRGWRRPKPLPGTSTSDNLDDIDPSATSH
jgi:hypothetical protein